MRARARCGCMAWVRSLCACAPARALGPACVVGSRKYSITQYGKTQHCNARMREPPTGYSLGAP